VEEAVVTLCIVVNRAEFVGKRNAGTERESKRRIKGGQNS
jgi:hypothetical protein